MKRIAVLLLGLCLLTGCAGTGEEEMNIMIENGEQQTAYDQVAVKRGDITHEISISCKYMPKERILIAFEGQQRIITEVLVEKGDFVTKGDVLARQDVEEFEELILEEQHAIEMQQLTLAQLEEMKALDLGLMEKSYNFQDEDAVPAVYGFDQQVPVAVLDGECIIDFSAMYEYIRFIYDREDSGEDPEV